MAAKKRRKSIRPNGRPKWTPEKACIEKNLTMHELVEKCVVARGQGMQSFEELAELELGCSVDALRAYMDREPFSGFTSAITRARTTRVAYVKGKMSAIINNDEHRYQGQMVKWFLEHFGGEEYKPVTRLEGTPDKPLFVGKPAPSVQKFLKDLAKARKG